MSSRCLTDRIWSRPRRNPVKRVNYSDSPLLSPNAENQVMGTCLSLEPTWPTHPVPGLLDCLPLWHQRTSVPCQHFPDSPTRSFCLSVMICVILPTFPSCPIAHRGCPKPLPLPGAPAHPALSPCSPRTLSSTSLSRAKVASPSATLTPAPCTAGRPLLW